MLLKYKTITAFTYLCL